MFLYFSQTVAVVVQTVKKRVRIQLIYYERFHFNTYVYTLFHQYTQNSEPQTNKMKKIRIDKTYYDSVNLDISKNICDNTISS